MDETTTVAALLDAATNPKKENLDGPSVEAFCAIINREKISPLFVLKLISNLLHSKNEKKILLTLEMLDVCMKKFGSLFISEVAKFRFLNELIKLVSPKYLGTQTTYNVKQKVIKLLDRWSKEYSKESKIKEALEMLRRQGVIPHHSSPIHDINNTEEKSLSNIYDEAKKKLLNEILQREHRDDLYAANQQKSSSVFYDEEKTKLLNKLLQSKQPDDLYAANKLIKNMVKEVEEADKLRAKKLSELDVIYNNIRLLNEMLDAYKTGESSADDLQLIHEMHGNCMLVQSKVYSLVDHAILYTELRGLLSKAVDVKEELLNVLEKFKEVVCYKGNFQESHHKTDSSNRISLLEFDVTEVPKQNGEKTDHEKPSLDLLDDILTPDVTINNLLKEDVLKPAKMSNVKICEVRENKNIANKSSVFDDLEELEQYLMKEQLNSESRISTFKKSLDKIPINNLIKQSSKDDSRDVISEALNLDLTYLISKERSGIEESKAFSCHVPDEKDDDSLVDLSKDVTYDSLSESLASSVSLLKLEKENENQKNINIDDLFLKLNDIEPSDVPPIVLLKEVQDVTVTLQFGKNKPKEFVQVVVVTTISKNKNPLSNYLFQAIAPKTCRLKLLAPSGTELPPYISFVPPMAITQIMFIANPICENVKLKFVVSFLVGDETVMETGEIQI